MEDILRDYRRALEASFFVHDQKLLSEFRQHLDALERREQLADASGLHDEAVLNRLVALNIKAETLAALTLIPLVEVAWADGKMQSRQKEALLNAMEQSGVHREDDAYALFESWLGTRPGPELLEAWKAYVAATSQQLDRDAVDRLKHDVLDRALTIADAAGGLLGLGNRVSKAERDKIDELAAAFA